MRRVMTPPFCPAVLTPLATRLCRVGGDAPGLAARSLSDRQRWNCEALRIANRMRHPPR